MRLPKLKPCPFCGEKIITEGTSSPKLFFVECNMCAALGPLKSTQHLARVAWNKAIRRVK